MRAWFSCCLTALAAGSNPAPPSVESLLANREIAKRRRNARGSKEDGSLPLLNRMYERGLSSSTTCRWNCFSANGKQRNALASLYQMYEWVVIDYNLGLRSAIEFFFNHSDWSVAALPDPKDGDPARYAILAVLPQFLVMAFNRLISMGLPRNAPAILDAETEEHLASLPRVLEEVPTWTLEVPKLPQLLSIPDADGNHLQGPEDERASQNFLAKNILMAKNILIATPHVLFI